MPAGTCAIISEPAPRYVRCGCPRCAVPCLQHPLPSQDLVLLQEVWVEDDADKLLEAASVSGLEHGLHFKSGLFGSGLVTLSRYPIVHTSFHCYSTAGDPIALACGDFYAGKGGQAPLQLPSCSIHGTPHQSAPAARPQTQPSNQHGARFHHNPFHILKQ